MTPRACAPPLLLVVDDEPGVLALVKRFAESEGFDVITRLGGRELLAKLPALKQDVALLDPTKPAITAATRVDTPEDFKAALTREAWDVAVSDPAVLTSFLLTALALRHRELDLPFIVVSGTIDEEIAVTILKAGAHDFVTTASGTGLPNVWISSCDQETKM
jgi:FixJ family two-component response regulator